jgi:hypothetical protein
MSTTTIGRKEEYTQHVVTLSPAPPSVECLKSRAENWTLLRTRHLSLVHLTAWNSEHRRTIREAYKSAGM